MADFRMGSKSLVPKPKGIGGRHMLALMGFTGFALSYAMRFNLSIAIVAMVNQTDREIKQPEVVFKTDVCASYHNENDLLSSSSSTQHSFTFMTDTDDPNDKNIQIAVGQGSNVQFGNISSTETLETLSRNESGVSIRLLRQSLENNEKVNEGDDGGQSDPLLDLESQGEFNWSESDQGVILGSFFWGYIITQIPGGWVGHRFGGKWPFGIGMLINAILAILTPAAAWIGGMKCVICVRFLQGFFGGMTVPSMHGLLAKWTPPDERGKITAFVYAGMPFGSALSMIISGYITHFLGWPFVFYTSGLVTIIWFALWVYLVYSGPDEHPRIDPIELKYIEHSIQGNSDCHNEAPKRPPWKKILTSMPFWAVIFGQTAETWGLYTFMTELPTYMKTVLHFDIKENSLMSAFPHVLTWIASIALTQVGDYLIEKRYASVGTVRKSCNTIALWGSAGLLIGVAYSGCNRMLTVTLIGIAIASLGGVYGGVLVNLIDIAPNYAGYLMGFSNTAASIPGVLAPWIAGNLINNDPSLENWRSVLLITASVSFFGNLLFIIFASGEEQPWNRSDDDDDIENKNKTHRDNAPVTVASFNEQYYNVHLKDTIPMGVIIANQENEDNQNEAKNHL